MRPLIALLTDFGTSDIYIGVMKGVMRQICPDADFIDITHGITPQSVRGGAFALKNSFAYFPQGTIFLVVIDPGVGSTRRPILVQAGGYTFVAPDNGVLSYALAEFDTYQAVALTNTTFHLDAVSYTFHGRDIFAPAAAHVARGDHDLAQMGEPIADMMLLPTPLLTVTPERISGEVVHIDHFGNIVTSVGPMKYGDGGKLALNNPAGRARLIAESVEVRVHDETISGIVAAYYEVPRGQLLAQIDSNGYVEIAINQGNAAQKLGITIGDMVEVIVNAEG